VAWGAYFARENDEDAALPLLVDWVDGWRPAAGSSVVRSHEQHEAMAEVLDALIEAKAEVVPERIGPDRIALVADDFPVQAAILAARLPREDAVPLLEAWYGKRGDGGHFMLARIAAMMLSNDPPEGFAASVLSETEDKWDVSVVDPHTGFGYGFGGGICSGLGMSAPRGWPPIYRYRIVSDAVSELPLLVASGGDRFTYKRGVFPEGSPGQVEPLNSESRQHLMLEMLGGDRAALAWRPSQQESIEWQGGERFLSELKALVASEEAKLRATVDGLYARGMVSAAEVNTVRPRLVVDVYDRRENGGASIPEFEVGDPRIRVEINEREQ
jgi:hypothetical protein